MPELLPSFMVLGSLLITLFILIKRASDRKAGTIVNCALMAALCFVGGLLLSAMYTRAVGNESSSPLIIAILVLIGSLGSLAIYIKLDNNKKKQLNNAE